LDVVGSEALVEIAVKHTSRGILLQVLSDLRETPLAEVAEEFNRYNSRRLVIVDPQLRSVGISGVYSSTDPDSLLGFLRAQPNIELSETDSEIRVTLREKK